MKTLEVDEILRILEKCGWQAWLCDTPVPVYESVHAGDPADPGQIPPSGVSGIRRIEHWQTEPRSC
jgi:hypothetical protein